MESRDGILVTKPEPLLLRELKADFKKLFGHVVKAGISLKLGKFTAIPSEVLGAIQSIGLRDDPGGTAWLLLWRAMTRAVAELYDEMSDRFEDGTLTDAEADRLAPSIERAMETNEIRVGPDFFSNIGNLPIIPHVAAALEERLKALKLSEVEAAGIAKRLKSYFVFAVADEGRNSKPTYEVLFQHEDLLTPEVKHRLRWDAYCQWLDRDLDKPIFDEAFGLRDVYVPLRAYYETKDDDANPEDDDRQAVGSQPKNVTRRVNWLADTLDAWLEQSPDNDWIRVLSGGPGSGKSSFMRWYAAQLAITNRNIDVLLVPLHHFNLRDDVEEALAEYCANHPLIKQNVLDPDRGSKRLLILFDGLDELASQGKVAGQLVSEFVLEVEQCLSRRNQREVKIQVVFSGRPVAVQTAQHRFRKDGQLLQLLPYVVEGGSYSDPHGLLKQDQRNDWWKKYGEVKGKGFAELPEDLKSKGPKFDEITAQPLLNYLVALSHDRGEVDFAGDVNLNEIYADLLAAVHERKYEHGRRSPAIEGLTQKSFERLLEEIALAAWHGNGRTTTVGEIQKHCEGSGLAKTLEQFAKDSETGVTRLLTAFYFQQRGDQDGDPTFEFTHKSFGEYLTVRRLVRLMKRIYDEMKRRDDPDEEPDAGWDRREALKHWVITCGPTEFDSDLTEFLRNEIRLRGKGCASEWQHCIIRLIEHVVSYGSPMERLLNVSSFQQQTLWARNAEESLIVFHSACAAFTDEVVELRWPQVNSAGTWIKRLCKQRTGDENALALNSLNHFSFRGQILYCSDFIDANLRSADLSGAKLNVATLASAKLCDASLKSASFMWADLRRTDFKRANLVLAGFPEANLKEANLEGANLERANLKEANLKEANLEGANLQRANLKEANLEEANLEGANLKEANLERANLEGANLEQANLEGANLVLAGFPEADLQRANLQEANLEEANLKEANLEEANLKEANLERANLEGANLEGARLEGTILEEKQHDPDDTQP